MKNCLTAAVIAKKLVKRTCHHCKSTDCKFIIKNRKYNWSYFFCLNCGLIFSNDLKNEDYRNKHISMHEMQQKFLKKSAGEKKRCEYLINFFTLEKLRKFRVLDIGCSLGSFAYALREFGVDVCGVDPNIQETNYAREKYGLNVHTDYFLEKDFGKYSFDLITCWRTLEHTPDPYGVFRKIGYCLKENGYVLISVPTGIGKSGRFQHDQWGGGHLRLYNGDSLAWFVGKNGFNVEDAIPCEEFFGTHRPGTLCLAKKASSPSLAERFPQELKKRLYEIERSLLKDRTFGRLKRLLSGHLSMTSWIRRT